MSAGTSIQSISVIVPKNPFVPETLQGIRHCLTALDVQKLMEWWPGTPHSPHRDSAKVKAIQRSLDWKRVAQIAAYLLQSEIVDTPERINKYFRSVYEPKKNEPGRVWPPKVPRVVGFQRSEYPTFSNVLLHVNGASVQPLTKGNEEGAAKLVFDEKDPDLNFSVIDGQHRINGAFLAVSILSEGKQPGATWEIPAEIFIDLDGRNEPPRRQAQIFIDVNFYQKKVDKSLVADLFPTARGRRRPIDNKERAQDLGRKLMLEVGPLVGMIQIPGIKFGVKDVVTLATLNSAIEDILEDLCVAGVDSLEVQAEFLSQCLEAFLEASGRREDVSGDELNPENVAYQGRVVVSFLALIPACIWKLKRSRYALVSDEAKEFLTQWLKEVMKNAGLMEGSKFLPKSKFKEKGYLGSGGLARFRDTLWAAALNAKSVSSFETDEIQALAEKSRGRVQAELANDNDH
jgi:DGQHR domain-containing protein